jgi:hypothetical protein
MNQAGLKGVPQRRRWRRGVVGTRPGNPNNHLDRDFTAPEPNQAWVTRHHLYPTRTDIFDCIERFYNPRMRLRLANTETADVARNSTVRGNGTQPRPALSVAWPFNVLDCWH